MKHLLHSLLLLLICLLLLACDGLDSEARIVGQLERERIILSAESSDPITEIPVVEGEFVQAGQLIAQQDTRLIDRNLARLEAEADRARARLDEVLRGPRNETIRAAEARLADARSRLEEANASWQRTVELRKQELVSAAELDSAIRQHESAKAALAAARAELDSLLEGSTVEELEQARAALKAAQAAVAELEVRRERFTLAAPAPATVEALPFEPGERPAPGQAIALLLAAGQPHAVVFVPAGQRAAFAAGTRVTVSVDGFGKFPGHVRHVAGEAAYTPYFALTQRERGRLSYRAEVELDGEAARDLPAGVPVDVLLEAGE